MTELSTPRIVCAANRYKGTIVLGARHHDRLMNAAIERAGLSGLKWEKGFIDQHGKFYNRQDAWKIAEVAGQIRKRVGGDYKDGGTLYSENLY